LIKEFDLFRIQKGGAIFDFNKLNWLSKKYISEIISTEEIVKRGQEFVPPEWILTPSIISAVKTRLEKLADLKEVVRLFFVTPDYPTDMLYFKGEQGSAKENLKKLLTTIQSTDIFNAENLKTSIFAIIPEGERGEYLWPLRVALSGAKESPGPFEIMEGLGKEEGISRIKQAIEKIKTASDDNNKSL